MSVTENNVLIRSKDSSGNSTLYYPVTKADNVDGLDEALELKVDKVTGKGLSTNDYTTAEKNKLAGIAEGANKTTVDSALSSTSTNPVQNKAVNAAISSLQTAVDGKAASSHTHTIANVDGLQTALDGKAASSHGTHVSFSTTTPKANGTAAVGTATTVARSDHVHPVQTSVSGNAGTATKLATARKIGLSGGVTGTATNFDGSSNITIPVTAVNPSKISDGYTTRGIYINTHPENQPAIIPFINNDIAFLLKRGGSAVVKVDGVIDSSNCSAVFDGSPSYWSPSLHSGKLITDGVTNVTIELTLHRTFSYGNTIYIDSGANAWRAKNITVEVMNSNYSDDTWSIKGSVTNHGFSQYKVTFSHAPQGANDTGGGFNKIRITFSNWNHEIFRLAAIGVINCASIGLRETFLPRDGGGLYGSLSPYSNNTNSLGTSNKKWKTVYAETFNGNLSGNAGSATKLATARTFRTNLGSTSTASFNGTADVTPGVTGTLGLANGGTGATTAAAGRANLGAAKVYWSADEPSDWTSNDVWFQIV